MDPIAFSLSLVDICTVIVSKLYSYKDMTRRRAHEVIDIFSDFLNNDQLSLLFDQLIQHLKDLGDSYDNIKTLESIVYNFQNCFNSFKTEKQCLAVFEKNGTYIKPLQVEVSIDNKYKKKDFSSELVQRPITIQFIPLRFCLKKFLEMPGIFKQIKLYLKNIGDYDIFLSNVIHGEAWKRKIAQFGDRFVLPLLLYRDDYETNNPLGSHKGLGKNGSIYITLPFLPPELRSKTENIFLLTLYKTKDLKTVDLSTILNSAVDELNFLESEGILINFSSEKQIHIYFSVIGVIGDNLAIHTLLGFIGSFSANYPCRFCLIHRDDINNVHNILGCKIRTEENYKSGLLLNDPKSTGIAGPSNLHKLMSASTLQLSTVDVVHDALEGFVQYDLGLIFNQFIINDQFFTLENLNNRIKGIYYGEDEIRNKPCEISINQINKKFIKMSAAETLCLLQNTGLLIGDWIPYDNQYWELIILLKELIDILIAPIIDRNICDYLDSSIEKYLKLLSRFFPGSLKPKHHFLLHYSEIIKNFGPVWNLCTMRGESKNRDGKTSAYNALNRLNVCKTIAIKNQLQVNYYLQRTNFEFKTFEHGNRAPILIRDLEDSEFYLKLLPNSQNQVFQLNYIVMKNRVIKKNVIIMIPAIDEPQLLLVKVVCENNDDLTIIVKDITNYSYYDEHFQSYKVNEKFVQDVTIYKSINTNDIEFCSVSRLVRGGDGN